MCKKLITTDLVAVATLNEERASLRLLLRLKHYNVGKIIVKVVITDQHALPRLQEEHYIFVGSAIVRN